MQSNSSKLLRCVWRGPFLAAILFASAGCMPEEAPGTPEMMTAELALGAAEYGPATWKPSPNYVNASRKIGSVKVVVVHTTQGSFAGAVSWLQNPKAKVSAHYVISKTGQVVQMVKEEDVAWHVGSENGYTIGIEHEGFVSDPNWVTPQMLDASAKLTCYLTKKWKLQPTKANIKGHVEMPNQTHTDPGKFWPWDKYIGMVAGCVNGTPPPCPGGCDDKNLCTTDSCASGKCAHANNAVACNDGKACTTGDKCGGGSCAGTSKNCDDNNVCTADTCNAQNGNCLHTNTTTLCNDGNACTTGDKCGAGKCSGVTKVCNDKNPCTDDGCSATTGACTTKVNVLPCDDGSPCSTGDKCAKGVCTGGPSKNCDDGNPCTNDGCKAGTCVAMPSSGPCDDGNACTSGDNCASGKCAGAQQMCADANACTADACDGGLCVFAPLGGACDDSDTCTENDTCINAACSGNAMACDDGKPCTVDSCNSGACTHSGGKPVQPICVGKDVYESDPCGATGKLLKACPAATPCKAGACKVAATDAGSTGGPDGGTTGDDSATAVDGSATSADDTSGASETSRQSQADSAGTPRTKDVKAAADTALGKSDIGGNPQFGTSDDAGEPPSPFYVPNNDGSSSCSSSSRSHVGPMAALLLAGLLALAVRRRKELRQ